MTVSHCRSQSFEPKVAELQWAQAHDSSLRMTHGNCGWGLAVVVGVLAQSCGGHNREFGDAASGEAGGAELGMAGASEAVTQGGTAGEATISTGGGDTASNPGGGGEDSAAGGEHSAAGGAAGAAASCTENACGGCELLSGAPGDGCGDCSEFVCEGADSLVCSSTCTGPTPFCKTGANACVACNLNTDCANETPVCHANACVACEPSSTRCAGTKQFLCDAKGETETPQSIKQGVCGAVCTPGALRCNNLIGQKCAPDGAGYVSSGSNVQCGCSAPERFSLDADGNVKDKDTSLVWDFEVHAPDTLAGASGTCAAKGFRLPTLKELETLLLTGTAAATCAENLQLGIDSVAFPGIVAELRIWTGDPEPGFPGYLHVGYFYGPSSSNGASGFGSTDRAAASLVAFQCVKTS
jgi:hypothetical protein